MINKLRKKFIVTAMLAVFGLLTAILLVINFVNFALVAEDADKVLQQIVDGGGQFGQQPPQMGQGAQPNEQSDGQTFEQGDRRPFGPNSPEIGQTTRFFTATFDESGNVVGVDMHLNAVTQEEAADWADSLKGGKGGWTRTYYRYTVWTDQAGTHVTVIDQSRELLPSYRVLIASLAGGAVGLAVTFLALLGISKAVVKPIEQSDRRQKQFVADASHELKNPITVIDTSRHVIELRDGESEESHAIGKEVGRLTQLVAGLDKLLLEEQSAPDKKEFDLSALTAEIASPYQRLFEQKGKTFEADVAQGLRYTGDPLKIGDLINIALDNALAYSQSQAALRLSKEGERLTLTASNDAPEVPDGPMDSVFERFYRSETVKESGIEGNGLGLAVAKEIVAAHGGRIWATGENGRFVLRAEL